MNKKISSIAIVLVALSQWIYAADRGSGSYSSQSIGPTPSRVYLPAAQENPGWGTDMSTNSLNLNTVIIASAIANLETLAGNTNYIQLSNTLQSGATAYIASFSVDGQSIFNRTSGNAGFGQLVPIYGVDISSNARITGLAYVATSSGSFAVGTITPTVSTGGAQIVNDVSIGGVLYSSGNVNLGDASGDLLNIRASSITLINPATFYAPTGSFFRYAESSATGKCFWTGNPLLLVSSNVSTTVSNAFYTIDLSTFIADAFHSPGGGAKVAFISSRCSIVSDGTVDASIPLYLRSTGSGVAQGNNTEACIAYEQVNTIRNVGRGFNSIVLNAQEQMDFVCQTGDTATERICTLYLSGVCF